MIWVFSGAARSCGLSLSNFASTVRRPRATLGGFEAPLGGFVCRVSSFFQVVFDHQPVTPGTIENHRNHDTGTGEDGLSRLAAGRTTGLPGERQPIVQCLFSAVAVTSSPRHVDELAHCPQSREALATNSATTSGSSNPEIGLPGLGPKGVGCHLLLDDGYGQ